MKVERTSVTKATDLKTGDCFLFDDTVYVVIDVDAYSRLIKDKIEKSIPGQNVLNALNLVISEFMFCVNIKTGRCLSIDKEEIVMPLPDAVLRY